MARNAIEPGDLAVITGSAIIREHLRVVDVVSGEIDFVASGPPAKLVMRSACFVSCSIRHWSLCITHGTVGWIRTGNLKRRTEGRQAWW